MALTVTYLRLHQRNLSHSRKGFPPVLKWYPDVNAALATHNMHNTVGRNG
jgi:hypothetical protein